MKILAGVDIGNSTTEVCLAEKDIQSNIKFLSSYSTNTTGIKGTIQNIVGIELALNKACYLSNISIKDIDLILLNEAAPVTSDTAMETITETIITDSTMIGHNPKTPAGFGAVCGELVSIENISVCKIGTKYLLTASNKYDYLYIANLVNENALIDIVGIILQADEAVLVYNRLNKKIPIIDEVKKIEKLLDNKYAAIEIALSGMTISMLSNPYGIATLLDLNAEQTKNIMPIAKSLIGKRSAVVIKTSQGIVSQNILDAGFINIRNKFNEVYKVSIDLGANEIMKTLKLAGEIEEIYGDLNSNIGLMFKRIKESLKSNSDSYKNDLITDILAIDTFAPVNIYGALADETCLEKAVGIAAMVKTNKLNMNLIANELTNKLGTNVYIAGVEAVMASIGALTTPGTALPLAILDLGGGSVDAALLDKTGSVRSIHLAGAGELVSLIIKTELGLKDLLIAEQIKRYPLAKVESLFHIRLETGEIKFFSQHLDPKLFGGVVMIKENSLNTESELILIDYDLEMEKIVAVRKEAKEKVFITNAMRALTHIAEDNNIRNIPNVVLVGGCALDFEISNMLSSKLADAKIVCGMGNIRRELGARNAVATGLVLSSI